MCQTPAMPETLWTLLESRKVPLVAALMSVLLGIPSLWGGWLADDWFHLSVLRGIDSEIVQDPVWDLFRFMDGGAGDVIQRDRGLITWWASDDLAIGFLRPLSALTHVLDHLLWPDASMLQHAHSLLWSGLAVLAVGLLLRSVLPDHPRAAGLGALLFACEDAHALPVAWLANRNAMVALAFGAAAVSAHVYWRRHGGLHRAAFAVALLASSLAAGESGIGAAAYMLAFQLTADHGPWRRRLAGILPAAVMVLSWRVLYNRLGYGAHGSGLYIDPGADPLAFAAAVLQRAPILNLAQWTSAPVDVVSVLPETAVLTTAITGLVITAGVTVLLWPLLQKQAEARFLALGSLGSLIGPCATFPMDRVLTFAGIGALGLIGLLIASYSEGWRRLPALGLGLWHGPVAALVLFTRISGGPLFGYLFAEGEACAPRDSMLENQTLVFLNANEFAVVYTPVIRLVRGDTPAPRRVQMLSSQFQDNELLREDHATLVLAPENGFLSVPVTGLMRNPSQPFEVGQTIERSDFTAEIRATTPDGRPAVVAFHFRTALEDAGLRFLVATDRGYTPWTPPPVGSRQSIPAAMPFGSLTYGNASPIEIWKRLPD